MFQGGGRSHPPSTYIPPEIREGGGGAKIDQYEGDTDWQFTISSLESSIENISIIK